MQLSYVFFQSNTVLFWSHFYFVSICLRLYKKLLDTCNMENANANLQKFDTMLFKKVKTLPVNNARVYFY